MNAKLNRPQQAADRLNQKLTDAMMAALKTVRSTASPDSMDAKDLAYQRKGQEVLGRLLPGRLVLFSPWTDMTASGISYTQREELDPMLTNRYIQAVRRAYAPEADYSLPQFSPLFAELSGLPPTLIQVGERPFP